MGISHYYGKSLIINPEGRLLWEAGHTETIATVTLSLDLVNQCREYGTIFMDHYIKHLKQYNFPMPYSSKISEAPVYNIGLHIKEVIPTSNIEQTVKTREPAIGDFYFVKGMTIVSTRYPIYKNNKFIGVIEYDIFENYSILKDFLKRSESIYNKLSSFKQEFNKVKGSKYSIENIVGISSHIQRIHSEIRNAAKTNSTVLITGETGTGKELVAHSIHELSQQNSGNFISVNCSAISFELFEAELFGFEEGSFTNARKGGKKGKFEIAKNGTLFLDEINQMPIKLQPKMLRALQEKEIDKIGGSHSIPIETRVICATNQNLKELVKKGLFREDLFFRINVIQIYLLPLRERKEDIPLIVNASFEYLNHFLNRNVVSISNEALSMLQKYDWPGNIRELQNVLERAINSIDINTHKLETKHFEFFIEEILKLNRNFVVPEFADNPLEEIKNQAEKQAIINVLEFCNGNKSKAAKILKIARPLLYQKIKRLGIE